MAKAGSNRLKQEVLSPTSSSYTLAGGQKISGGPGGLKGLKGLVRLRL